jgi:hypothetical protein
VYHNRHTRLFALLVFLVQLFVSHPASIYLYNQFQGLLNLMNIEQERVHGFGSYVSIRCTTIAVLFHLFHSPVALPFHPIQGKRRERLRHTRLIALLVFLVQLFVSHPASIYLYNQFQGLRLYDTVARADNYFAEYRMLFLRRHSNERDIFRGSYIDVIKSRLRKNYMWQSKYRSLLMTVTNMWQLKYRSLLKTVTNMWQC